jgi:hypothetical protein
VQNDSDAIVRSAAERMSIAFDLQEPDDTLAVPDLLYRIKEELVRRIIGLLNSNPERLMAILYRIDVSEATVNEIFATAQPPDVPDLIADLIIERQLDKARTRAAYRGGTS